MGKKYHRVKRLEKQRRKEFVPDHKATRKLGFQERNFEKLCILKGVTPKELPEGYRKKFVNKKSKERSYYERKDISALLRDDVRHTLFEKKGVENQKAKYKGKNEQEKYGHILRNMPKFNVDHVILELYPTFNHALQSLDDTLTTIFLNASLTVGSRELIETSHKCKQVAIDFMNYVITAKALRKVFISFKGYYYQAVIQSHKITWIVPHPMQLTTEGASQRAKMIVGTSTTFGVNFLQFVNFKLYQNLDLIYPPKIKSYVGKINKRKEVQPDDKTSLTCTFNEMRGKIASLNTPLLTTSDEQTTDDSYEMGLLTGTLGLKTQKAVDNLNTALRQKVLFKGLKFFLGREINRESLTFVIRCAGGEVSWDKTVGLGYRYQQEDERITHQIIDRPETGIQTKYLTRSYVQPQWIYDSFNAGRLFPVEDYFVGQPLPPHLSPFEESYGTYVPPEKKQLKLQEGEEETVIPPMLESKKKIKRKSKSTKHIAPTNMSVVKGRVTKKNVAVEKEKTQNEANAISKSLIPVKKRKFFDMVRGKEVKGLKVVEKLTQARSAFDKFTEQRKKT